MFAWGLLCLIVTLMCLGSLSKPDGGTFWALAFAGLFGFLAYRAWKRSEIVEHQLFLMTSSSEAQAFVSRDGSMIEGLRERIERAMVGQLAG
jgi:hypothetical protein